MPWLKGGRLGLYEILEPLGAGGMGEVYRARDTRLGREIALKLLPEAFARDAERLARFEREARTIATLNHPSIVTLHSIEDVDGVRFLTMELVEGRDLTELVHAGGLPLAQALDLSIPLAEALVAAHDKGVVHRDLKPANVMLTREGRVKVLDFGLAKLTQAAHDERTQAATRSLELSTAGSVMGTAPYMSPEQIRGAAVDSRSDLFSFGILVYELVTGKRPFGGDSAADVTSAILRDPAPPLASTRDDLPGELDRIIGRCLEKDPRQRVQTAGEVLQDLRGLKRALDTGTLMPSSPPRTLLATEPLTVATAPGRGRSRGVWPWVVVALIAVAAAGFFLYRQTSSTRTAKGADDKQSVGVLEFENVTGDPEIDWMKRGVAELLSAALVQSPQLDVFDAQRLGDLAAADRTSAAPSIAFLARHGIHRAITGSIMRSGGDLRIQGRLVDTESGRPVRSYAVEGAADSGLFHLVGRLIPDLQVALEVNLTGNREAEGWLREITTTSADAYRFYLRGHQALLASHWKEAVSAFEDALALDSLFVAARTELSGAYWNLGDETQLSLTRAAMQRLRPRADHRNQLRIDLLESVVGGDPPGVVRAASQLHDLYPENRFFTYLMGRGYYYTQQYQRCIDVLRPLAEQRYKWAWTYVLTARSHEKLGDLAAARRAWELGTEVTQDPELLYAYVRFLRQQGDHARCRPIIDQGLRSPAIGENPVAEGELRLELARDHLMRGNQAQARAELERASRLIPQGDEARPDADSLLAVLKMK